MVYLTTLLNNTLCSVKLLDY